MRKVPLVILQREVLLERLSHVYPKRKLVSDDLGAMWSGFKGELTLDYDLRFLPYRSYQIIHDIRLNVFGKHFQIDTLVLSPYAAFIIEAKNYAGTIFYDEESETFKQRVRGKVKTIDDPLIQVTRQQKQLEEWLRHRGIHGYPIIPMVAICNPSTIVIPPKNHTHPWPIMNSIHTVDRIQKTENLYKDRNRADIELIQNKIIPADIPLEQDLLSNYSIKPTDIKLGVQCPRCSSLPMGYVKSRWQCTNCGHRSSDAYLQALADYFMLFKDTMTNRECRKFLGCSQDLAYYLLSKSGLSHNGGTKGRKYQRPDDLREFIYRDQKSHAQKGMRFRDPAP